MLKSLLSKITLTVPLGWLFSHIFMWSNNAHTFSNIAMLYSLGFIFVVATIFWIIGVLWIKFSHHIFHKHIMILDVINVVGFSGVLSTIVGIFLLDPMLNPDSVKIPVVIFFIVSYLLLYYFKTFLNTMLAFMLILSTCNLGLYFINQNKDVNNISQANIPLVEFKTKPNIYLFWLESYHDFDTQRNVYGIDTQNMQNYLIENSFVTYNHVYTDGAYTLAAFAELEGMGYKTIKELGNSDASIDIRNLLGGNDDNLMLKILKHNSYHTTRLLMGSPFYVMTFTNSQYLDQTDHDHLYNSLESLLYPCYYFIKQSIATTISGFLRNFANLDKETITGTLAERVNTVMQQGLLNEAPIFISFKGGAVHTPSVGYSYKNDLQDWIDDGRYNQAIENANIEIKSIIDNIVEHDPSSIIILISDHAARRYRGLTEGSIEDLRIRLEGENISYKSYVDDIFGGMLAIRFPNGEEMDITAGHYMSQRNLFLHIYAYLSESQDLLSFRKQSSSEFWGSTMTRDGVLLYE